MVVGEPGGTRFDTWGEKIYIDKCGARYEEFHTQNEAAKMQQAKISLNPSAWGHLNPSSYCDVGRLFYGVFKLWSKLQRKK